MFAKLITDLLNQKFIHLFFLILCAEQCTCNGVISLENLKIKCIFNKLGTDAETSRRKWSYREVNM